MKRLTVAMLLLALVGCGGSGGSTNTTTTGTQSTASSASAVAAGQPASGGLGGVNQSAEEPEVRIRNTQVKAARATVTVNGFAMDVSGTGPNRQPYNFQNFVIKGAGLQGISQPPYGLQQFTYPYMNLLANGSGANCIRCYGAALSQETPAQQQTDIQAALTWANNATIGGQPTFVAVGLTMLPSTQLDYTNTSSGSPLLVQRAGIEQLVQNVVALDNSRQLLWVIGNELAQNPSATVRAAVYKEINVIAQYIRATAGSQLPRMTAVPTVTTDELQLIAANCPDLDILGVNDYYGTFGSVQGGGFLNTLNATMVASQGQSGGWNKPYIVSEYGSYDLASTQMPIVNLPNPPPFVAAAIYGLEANSTAIAADYVNNYKNFIAPFVSGQGCLGSFAYIWENPVFANNYAYFFEIFASGADETPSYNPPGKLLFQAVDSLISDWGGTSPGVPYPQITSADGDPQAIQCSFKYTQTNLSPGAVTHGTTQTASVTASASAQLTFNWYLVTDTANHYNPQAFEGTASTVPPGASQSTSGTTGSQTNTLTFTAPTTPGNYQLRVIISTGGNQGTAATAAILFTVQ